MKSEFFLKLCLVLIVWSFFIGTSLARIYDLNNVTEKELCSLPGIGKVLAQRIIEYRKEHGRFVSVEELLNVKGIGKKKLKKLRKYLKVDTSLGLTTQKEDFSKNETSTFQAKIYYYKDERGIVHFTQFPNEVPAKYRSRLKPWH